MNSKTRTENSITNILTGVGGYFLNVAIAFACRMVFVRVLSESYLGLNSLLSNIFSVLSIIELGVGNGIIYCLYKPVHDKDEKEMAALMEMARKAYYFMGFFVAVSGLIVMLFLNKIIGDTGDISENIYLIYITHLISLVSGYFFNYKAFILTAHQKVYAVSGLSYFISILQSLVQIIMLLCFKSYWAYVVVIVCGTLLYNFLITVIVNKKYPYLRKYRKEKVTSISTKELIENFKGVAVYRLSDVCLNNTDSILITAYQGLNLTGVATNYSLFVTTMNSLLQQILNAIVPSVGNMNVEKSRDEQYDFFNSLFRINFWMYSWAAIGLAFVSTDLVRLLYGEAYAMDIKIPIVLALSFFIAGIQNPIIIYKNTRGIFNQGQYVLLFTAAINIVGDIILGRQFGIIGIFSATIIARLLTVSWYEPYVIFKRAFNRKPFEYYKKYLCSFLILLIEGAICYCFCSFIQFSPVVNVILKAIICTVIPNSVLIFYRNDKDFLRIKSLIVKMLLSLKRKPNSKGLKKSVNS